MSLSRHDIRRPVLEVRELSVDLGGIAALEDVSFTLDRGDGVAVVGPNGAGKSTLFRAIAGVLDRYRGRITVYGSDPGGHICIAYVPQASHVDWAFPVTVFDAVMMGRTRRIGWVRRPRRSDRALVYQCLEMVNMEDLAGRQIGRLRIAPSTAPFEVSVVYEHQPSGAAAPTVVSFSQRVLTVPKPEQWTLHANAPNPFNAATTIRYDVPVEARVSLRVFNLAGQRVAVLVDEVRPIGRHYVTWDGTDASGRPVASALYIVELRAERVRVMRRMILAR